MYAGSPDIYKTKASLIPVQHKSSAFAVIGDTEADIILAHDLKVPCIAVTSGIRNNEVLARAHPDYIVSDISKLSTLPILHL